MNLPLQIADKDDLLPSSDSHSDDLSSTAIDSLTSHIPVLHKAEATLAEQVSVCVCHLLLCAKVYVFAMCRMQNNLR